MARKTREQPDNRPKNKAERAFYDLMVSKNWQISKRGWPDFACWKDGKFAVVEVKRKGKHRLKTEQYAILRILASFGIQAYRWSPTDGFVQIKSPFDRYPQKPE
jgi:hypothetical protein